MTVTIVPEQNPAGEAHLEPFLTELVNESLDSYAYSNAVFLCERLHAASPTEVRSFSPPSVQSISGHPIDLIQLGRRGPSGAFVTRGFDSRSGRGSSSPKRSAIHSRPPPTAHLTLPPPDQSTHTRPTNTSWPRATTDTTRPTERTTH